ncbi:MAG: PEP-CTERM sorting domain-containing protein [Aquincola tertiaricarbonis]|uniref:PEP-CTERM sorting domain-containing protein n=1 Tax=Aquincola sp. J276 TaxID=2898432 RepID=UPI002151DF00|nr:PEP-CTERM sorting domain-containing protein [Aquincola sp. J276]MCR5867053.1 PEP-CTERM sorting domain-containing protein [Aquincola sp. J276]
MSRQLTRLAAAVAFALLAPLASAATVLSFDDLADGALPSGYGGLQWSAAWLSFADAGEPFGTHSGNRQLATDWGADNTATLIRFGQAATFQGAWFSGYEDAAVSFSLYYQGQQVATSALLTPAPSSAFLASGYAGLVDAVAVNSAAHSYFGMDDFTFTAAVPEPETYALMLAGLAAVGLMARRRRAA